MGGLPSDFMAALNMVEFLRVCICTRAHLHRRIV